MNKTDLNEMYKLHELLEMRAKQMEKELSEAIADVFKKYGQPLSIDDFHNLTLSLLILKSYGYTTPQQIHKLMYELGKKINFNEV